MKGSGEMKTIKLNISLSDDLCLKTVTIDENDTGLPDNHITLTRVAFAIIKAVNANKEHLAVHDLLNELNIDTE